MRGRRIRIWNRGTPGRIRIWNGGTPRRGHWCWGEWVGDPREISSIIPHCRGLLVVRWRNLAMYVARCGGSRRWYIVVGSS